MVRGRKMKTRYEFALLKEKQIWRWKKVISVSEPDDQSFVFSLKLLLCIVKYYSLMRNDDDRRAKIL